MNPKLHGRAVSIGIVLSLLLWSAAEPAPAVADPRIDYMLHCQGCHGPDGSGATGAAPSFRGQVGKFLHVPGGREYLIRVPGTSRSELNDAATAALLNWLVLEFSAAQAPADFAPFTEAEVASLRRPAFSDPGSVRRALLEKMGERE